MDKRQFLILMKKKRTIWLIVCIIEFALIAAAILSNKKYIITPDVPGNNFEIHLNPDKDGDYVLDESFWQTWENIVKDEKNDYPEIYETAARMINTGKVSDKKL